MRKDEFVKTYVRLDTTAVLTCPACSRQRVISAESFKGYRHKLKVKCFCKRHFMVFLEFRRRIRRITQLNGSYKNLTRNGSKCSLVVLDVSEIGLTIATIDAQDIKLNDELNVEFNLDDEHRTQIRKEVVVRSMRPGAVGGEFDPDKEIAADRALGHYVMSRESCVAT